VRSSERRDREKEKEEKGTSKSVSPQFPVFDFARYGLGDDLPKALEKLKPLLALRIVCSCNNSVHSTLAQSAGRVVVVNSVKIPSVTGVAAVAGARWARCISSNDGSDDDQLRY